MRTCFYRHQDATKLRSLWSFLYSVRHAATKTSFYSKSSQSQWQKEIDKKRDSFPLISLHRSKSAPPSHRVLFTCQILSSVAHSSNCFSKDLISVSRRTADSS